MAAVLAWACAEPQPPASAAPPASTQPEPLTAAPSTATPTPAGEAPSATVPARPTATGAAPGAPAVPNPIAAPELERLLSERGVRGVVAVLDGESGSARCSDVERCKQRFVPASTFKIPNSIIGLETGVIPDAEFVIPWDGVKRSMDAWNHDHSLRTAIRDSAVWYYQELARRVGPERMRGWLERLHYGNRQMGDVVDQFWLQGPLQISPLEQLDFLRRLARDRLPISPRSRDIVLDILVRSELDGHTLRGKTGWAAPETPEEVGWYVGYWDGPTEPRYVAVVVLAAPKAFDMRGQRKAIAEEALRSH